MWVWVFDEGMGGGAVSLIGLKRVVVAKCSSQRHATCMPSLEVYALPPFLGCQ